MTDKEYEKLRKIFETFPEIKLAYLFGSRANGDIGPLSDYDFAVYVDTKDANKTFEIKAALQDQIGRMLKNGKIDIVALNTAQSPELKYNIIKNGKIIFEREPFKIIVEPRILNEYFDFHAQLLRHGLTKA